MAETSSGDQRSGVDEGVAHPQANGRAAPVERVERWPIAKLLPYAGNPKTHPPEQVELIAKSMARFGQAQLILIDGDEGPAHGEIIAGHGRVLAAAQLGWDSLAVGEARGWSGEEKRAYRIADNQLAVAPWDMSLLKLEAKDLKLGGFDMGLLGFDAPSMFQLLAAEPAVDAEAEAAPELPKVPVVHTGDLWVLGNHRLLCGDATSATDVAKLLGEDKPHLMVTDPPYGVDFDPTWRKGSEKRTYLVDQPDNEWAWVPAWKLFNGDVCYIWHSSWDIAPLYNNLNALGFDIRAQIIWDKERFIIGRGHYCFNHEPCFYGVRRGGSSQWQGARDQPTIWRIKHRASDTNHGAQKPVECMKRAIENSSAAGDFVYDPFVGSGTTIIAAEIAARRCLAIEIDPGYCDVSVHRFIAFTGGSDKVFLSTDDGNIPYEKVCKMRRHKATRKLLSGQKPKRVLSKVQGLSRQSRTSVPRVQKHV